MYNDLQLMLFIRAVVFRIIVHLLVACGNDY